MKHIVGNLNGWQRLWVVCGILYIFSGGFLVVQLMPHDLTINEYLGEAVDEGDRIPSDTLRYARIDDKWVMVDRIQKNNETNEYRYLLNNIWSQPQPLIQYEKIPHNLNDSEMKTLRAKQFQFIGLGFTYLLASWIMVYVLGSSIAWIIAGFRNKSVLPPRAQ